MASLSGNDRGKRVERRKFIKQLICLGGVSTGLSFSGCGTILHSERIHRHHSRDIDWAIVALDGLGLALFFVPGVIAFAVDFYSGAIYLPPEGHALNPVGGTRANTGESSTSIAGELPETVESYPPMSAWPRIAVPRSELGPDRIDEVVSNRLGTRYCVLESETRVSRLSAPAEFTRQLKRHLCDADFGRTARGFFGVPA